jgi:hypothetical protein
MTEQLLDRADVITVFQQMRGERVAQRVATRLTIPHDKEQSGKCGILCRSGNTLISRKVR